MAVFTKVTKLDILNIENQFNLGKIKKFKGIKKGIENTNYLITIKNKKGDIKKLINKNDTNYFGFGELYLTYCNFDEVKAWKKHKKMFSNLIILKGKMKIVIHNENYQNENSSKYNEYILSEKKMSKLTIQQSK